MPDPDDQQSQGRKDNAAQQPPDAKAAAIAPEAYPAVRRDDAVESAGENRSFDPPAKNPQPRQGAGDTTAPEGDLTGPRGDPAEGKP